MRSVSAAAAVGHHPHQLDAAARAVVLVAHLGERRTTRRTQPAVNAAQEQIVADARGRVRLGWIELSELFDDSLRAHHVEYYESPGVQDVLRIETFFDGLHDAESGPGGPQISAVERVSRWAASNTIIVAAECRGHPDEVAPTMRFRKRSYPLSSPAPLATLRCESTPSPAWA